VILPGARPVALGPVLALLDRVCGLSVKYAVDTPSLAHELVLFPARKPYRKNVGFLIGVERKRKIKV
jgi:hypothetical protein